MRVRSIPILMILLLSQVARPAQAQETNRRDGFWWGFGLGYGWVNVACDICIADRSTAISPSGRLGGTITPKILMGGEASAWIQSDGEVDEFLTAFSAVAYWYLRPRGNFYLKTGLAYLSYRIKDAEDVLTSNGFGPQLGAAYDVRLTKRISLVPHFNAIITIPTGKLYLNGDQQADKVSLSLLQLGLGLTWH